jgi:serine/threonine protein kinase
VTTRSSTPLVPVPGGRERFGKYEILRRLAVGGMAEIYLARAGGIEGFEKHVVLKRILPQYADNEEFVNMFLDEARLAATLHHSNVVQVYDIGAVDSQYFLTMEYLEGQDGRQLMRNVTQRGGALPLEHALSIVMGVCAGLHYAHTRLVDGKPLNLVHRDVSPQNVFVTYDGGVKLLDFGIARASSRLSETRGGTLKGKIAYMSPEQCAGQPLDQRSDIFSAAIILWELTTGRRLFTGDNDFEVMRKVKEEDPPRPSAVSFAYPLALEKIVLKGLKRNRDERYHSAEDLLLDLDAFAREAKLAVSPVRLSRWMRETFAYEIEAMRRAMRGEAVPASMAGVGSEVMRTETSVPGPPPPLMISDPAVVLPPPRRSRTWMAVAGGILVGSLATWLAARQEPRQEAAVPPAVTAPAPTPATAPVVTPPKPVVTPLKPVVRELPTPPAVDKIAAPVDKPAAPVAKPAAKATPPIAKPAAPVEKTAATVDDTAKPTPPKRPATPVRRVVKKASPPKKPPPGWDPESILPP